MCWFGFVSYVCHVLVLFCILYLSDFVWVCDLDIDGDGVPNSLETAVGTNPNNANDAAAAAQAVIDAVANGGTGEVEEIQIPMIGGFGLLALGLSVIGLGALKTRRR